MLVLYQHSAGILPKPNNLKGTKMSEAEYDLQAVCANCGNRFGDHRTADNGCPLARTWRNHHPGFSNVKQFKLVTPWVPVETRLINQAFADTGFADSTDKLTDIPVSLLDGLIELFSEDLGCDHSVGICMCGLVALVAELKLAKMGKTYCPNCHGDGYVWSQEMYDKYAKDHDGYGYDFDSEGNVACGVCNKTGIVSTDI